MSIIADNHSEKDILLARTGKKTTGCSDSLPNINIGKIIKPNTAVEENIVITECNTYLFILSMDTVNKYSWENIRDNNRYMKKYIIKDKDDLKTIRYTISSP